jgi:putative membrane protein
VVRFLISISVQLIANAIGIIVAAWVLDDMSLSAGAFLLDVLIFTGIEFIAQPVITKAGLRHTDALLGSSALVASFIALVLTAWLSDGLQINGATTWLLATLIIWLASLVAALLLPVVVFKKWLRQEPARRPAR